MNGPHQYNRQGVICELDAHEHGIIELIHARRWSLLFLLREQGCVVANQFYGRRDLAESSGQATSAFWLFDAGKFQLV